MSLTVGLIINISLMAALIAGLTYVMRLPYHLPSPTPVQAAGRAESDRPVASRMEPVPFAPHPQFAYEARRAARGEPRQESEAEDVVATVQRLIDGDYDEWHEEWMATADQIAAHRASQSSGAGLVHGDLAS